MTKTQQDIRRYTIRRNMLKAVLFFSILIAVVHTVLFDVNRETVWVWGFVGLMWFGIRRAGSHLDERLEKLKKRQAAYEERKKTKNSSTQKNNPKETEDDAAAILKALQHDRQKKASTRRRAKSGKQSESE